MILTPERSADIGEMVRAQVERGLAAKGLSARRASLDVVGNDGLIRDIRAGRIPSFDRLAALFEYLGIALELGAPDKPRTPGFAEPGPTREGSDLLRREALRAGFLPFPFHRLSARRGTAPIAFSNAWLQDNGLDPERLSFVDPDISLLHHLPAGTTLALVTQNAPQTGNDAWCFIEAGQTVLARLHWQDRLTLVISSDDPTRPARVLLNEARGDLTVLGRVVWAGYGWP